MNETTTVIPDLIYEIRGYKVMLDGDLAWLYGVPVKRLNESVKRNIGRFPSDFMFQLSDSEWETLRFQIGISNSALRSQIATSNDLTSQTAISNEPLRSHIVTSNLKSQIATSSWGGRRKLPYVFTENGVAMLSSVLNSPRAIEINIAIMRVFTNIRQYMLRQAFKMDEIKELRQMLMLHIDNTNTRLDGHDQHIQEIIQVLNNLVEHPPPRRRIGFHADQGE